MLKRSYALIVFSLALSIIIHAQMPASDEPWFATRLMVGLFGLIFLPGFILSIITLDEVNVGISFSLILGFMLQLLNVYAIWVVHIFYGPVNFALLIYALTLAEVISVIILFYKCKLALGVGRAYDNFKPDLAILAIIVLYLILAFHWQQFAPAPHSDGAAYMDMARNVVEKGGFYSNMLFPTNTWSYVEYSSGMQEHMFGYFAISLFFMLGNISLFSAKIMLIFTGLLLILVLYGLVKKLFNVNVARLAALITAISPELLTHVGLVGGPEIPSALFTVFAVYLLVNAPASKRKLSMAFMAGLALFIAWYAWEFNLLVTLTFLPLLFMYTAATRKEFKVSDVLLLLLLLASFVLEWRVMLNFTKIIVDVPIPSLIVATSIVVYFLRLRKSRNRNTLIIFTTMFLALYLLLYSRAIVAIFIPQVQHFVSSVQPGMELVTFNIVKDVGVLSRAFSLEEVNKYWNMYWNGVYEYIGTVTIFLGFISLVRIDKLKETSLILSFPLLQAVWWGLFTTVDGFQPRYIVCSSPFYFILAASAIEMFHLYGVKTLEMTNKLHVNVKVKLWKASCYINEKNLAAVFVIGLLLASIFNFTYPIYDKQKKVMEGWNYPQIFGWNPAIEWIRNNTNVDDVIMSRSANYFAWYTGRMIAWPPINSSIGLNDLIDSIRMYKAKYLLIDERAYYLYPNLRGLYLSTEGFLDSNVVFQSEINSHKVIIYNVTNIAYGELRVEAAYILSADDIGHVTLHPYYTTAGAVEKDSSQDINGSASIRVTAVIKDVPGPSSTIIVNVDTLNMTGYDYLIFWIKAPNATQIGFVASQDGNNYFIYPKFNLPSGDWGKIVIPVKAYTSVYGKPDLSQIRDLRVYVYGRTPGEKYTFWLGSIMLVKERYILP